MIRFVQAVLAWLQDQHIDVQSYYLDHICYRVATQEEYQQWISNLKQLNAELLIESMIGGRLISTFKLAEPIIVHDVTVKPPLERRISLLELPAPKPGRYYESGLEHVEFALLPCSLSRVEASTNKTELKQFIQRYPQLAWNTSGLEKKVNGDVRLDFTLDKSFITQQEGTLKASVKFHLVDLETIIQLEKTCLSTTN